MNIHISELEIHNFRGIETARIRFSEKNFLIGNNGTGKTACLAAIARLLPILRNEERVFLDADFYFKDAKTALPIKLTYLFDLVFDDAITKTLKLEVVVNRNEQDQSRAHLNDQKVGEYSVSFPETSNTTELLEAFNNKGLFTQRVIRNGWGGGRICPINLNQNEKQKHAATSTHEESGAFDGFRARVVQLLGNTDIGTVVNSEHPDLIKNVLNFANSFLNEHRFDDIQLGHNELLNLIRPDGSVHTWESLSGGEQSAFNLAMAIEFSICSQAQFIFIEEPETTLHPLVQKTFLEIVRNQLSDRQLFISTHSPYIFSEHLDSSTLIICKKLSDGINLENAESCQWLFRRPSLGELSFHAYDLPMFEYHNELYGWLQEKTRSWKEVEMDNFLVSQGCAQDKNWIRDQNGTIRSDPRTVMTYIRNFTHHPENTHNNPYTENELKDSISHMYAIVKLMS